MKFKIFKYDTVNSTNEKAIELIRKKKYENGFQKKEIFLVQFSSILKKIIQV